MTEPPRMGHYMARVRRLHGAGPHADPAASHLVRTLRPLITFSGCVLVVACLFRGAGQTWQDRSAFDHLLEMLSLPLRREL